MSNSPAEHGRRAPDPRPPLLFELRHQPEVPRRLENMSSPRAPSGKFLELTRLESLPDQSQPCWQGPPISSVFDLDAQRQSRWPPHAEPRPVPPSIIREAFRPLSLHYVGPRPDLLHERLILQRLQVNLNVRQRTGNRRFRQCNAGRQIRTHVRIGYLPPLLG